MIVNVGKIIACYCIKGDIVTDGYPSHMACGTGTTAAAAGDTALETEVTRVALASATVDEGNKKTTYEALFTFGGPYDITEYGLLTAASGGNLFNRKLRTAIPVTTDTQLTIQMEVTKS